MWVFSLPVPLLPSDGQADQCALPQDHLLRRAVRKLAKGRDPASAKIPWKQVGEYIVKNGGSYHFGNTTCRKRWDALAAEEQQGGESFDVVSPTR